MARLSRATIAVACGLAAFSRCVCAPQDRGGDDDLPPPIDARPPPVIDAPPEIDAPDNPTGLPPDCFDAAKRGLAWLVTQQQVDGHYGSTYPTATTAFAVLKLETYAQELGLSAFDQTFVYHNQVKAGLDYLFLQARKVPIGPQLHGNPDGNGNGLGVLFAGNGIGEEIYEHSVVVMAIAAGAKPDQLVNVPGSEVDGETYRAVLEDAVDYLSWAQADASSSSSSSCLRGGWRYESFDNSGEVGDNSVTQWATLALEYARHPLYHYEIPVQDWVLTEVRDWVTCIQNHSGGSDDGGSGYTSPSSIVNAYKTGALIQQASFLGDMADTANMMAAQAYLQRVWLNPSIGWKNPPVSDYLAMYAIMKGMESMAIDSLGPIDWYREFCDELKLEQHPDGSWSPTTWDRERVGGSGLQSTEWALLVLEKAAPPPEIIP
ncbi:MAG TPA: hypothetical protein VHE35_32640 [Kofleriaceae bacterium]|nr:hypothetical protein [Kofleriaceae bacterium]